MKQKVENSPNGSRKKRFPKCAKVDPQSRLMSMCWVLTWKPSDEHSHGRKAKARIVILEYQHQEVAELKVSSPTLSGLGKMFTLQWTAFNHAELDTRCNAKTMYSTVRLAKVVYGIGNAPRSWWLSVDQFLTSMGGRIRQASTLL